MKDRFLKWLLPIMGAGWVYLRFVRPWIINWGATNDEVISSLPGDDILSQVHLQTTRGVTIDAPPEHVWPWLVQIGPPPRAGIYTYDWLERLLGINIRNAGHILPEHQHLEPGEFFALNADGSNGLYIRDVERERAIVMQWKNALSTWSFVLEPVAGGKTRLISRNRIAGRGPAFWLGMAFMEPASLVMERKMLLGIKERAESLSPAELAAALAGNNGH